MTWTTFTSLCTCLAKISHICVAMYFVVRNSEGFSSTGRVGYKHQGRKSSDIVRLLSEDVRLLSERIKLMSESESDARLPELVQRGI